MTVRAMTVAAIALTATALAAGRRMPKPAA
jgi:hypothetical protein